MIVVFDSNIWLSQLGLRSPAASAVRFFLKQNNYPVALPEVVRLEVEGNLETALIKHINAIEDAHRQLLTVFGTLKEVVLPTGDEVRELVQRVFSSSGVEVIAIPFSLSSARNSFLKTIRADPPSDRNQQFKDGVIWADCLALANTDDVTLVTSDKAFYQGHDVNHALAKNLQQEADQCPHKIRVVPTLATLMESLPKLFVFDDDALVEVLLQKAEHNVSIFLTKNGFEIGETMGIEKNVFATEDPGILFFECSVSIACEDFLDLQAPAVLRLEADGLYSPELNSFSDVGMREVSFRFLGVDGTQEERRGLYLRAESGVLGHREVNSKIRHKLQA